MSQVVTRKSPGTIAELITQQMPAIAMVVGGSTSAERQRRAERFARIVLTAVNQNPKLAQCTQASFAAALMNVAQMDLEPNTPQQLAHLIPYENRKRGIIECQLQIGYPGLMELAYRTGKVANFNADVVYRKEVEAGLFRYTKGVKPTIHHECDLLGNTREGELVAAYASVEMKDGTNLFRVVDRKEVERAMKASQSAKIDYSPWKTDPESMWIKTAIKRLCKFLPRTEQLSLAVELDEKAERGESQLPQIPAATALNEALSNNMELPPSEEIIPEAQPKTVDEIKMPETVECRTGTMVRTAVECQKCDERGDCPHWS